MKNKDQGEYHTLGELDRDSGDNSQDVIGDLINGLARRKETLQGSVHGALTVAEDETGNSRSH